MTSRWDRAVHELLERESLTDIALGLVDGVSLRRKFGRNAEINTGTVPEDLWAGGGLYTGQPTSLTAEKVTLSSDDVNDTLLGTGARTVRLEGLDTDLLFQTEELELDGLTLVESVKIYRRLSRAQVLTAGTLGHNVGTLSIAHLTTTANIFVKMAPTLNQTAICADTVPSDGVCLLLSWQPSATKGGGGLTEAVALRLFVRSLGSVYQVRDFLDVGPGATPTNRPLYELLEAGTDWVVRVTEVGANNTAASASVLSIHVETEVLANYARI